MEPALADEADEAGYRLAVIARVEDQALDAATSFCASLHASVTTTEASVGQRRVMDVDRYIAALTSWMPVRLSRNHGQPTAI